MVEARVKRPTREEAHEATGKYLRGEITLDEYNRVLWPEGRPRYSRSDLVRLCARIKFLREEMEVRLKEAGLTIDGATEKYLRGEISLDYYMYLLHGKRR